MQRAKLRTPLTVNDNTSGEPARRGLHAAAGSAWLPSAVHAEGVAVLQAVLPLGRKHGRESTRRLAAVVQPAAVLPTRLDFVEKGVVTPAGMQKPCGE